VKVVITGKGGQLAEALLQTAPSTMNIVAVGVKELDITDDSAVFQLIEFEKPDVVINCAAYTAVDKAESDIDMAYAVNEAGAQYLANACKNTGARLLHVSTDFVFDGRKPEPYQTNDEPNPLNVYGASKLAGEQSVLGTLPGSSVVVRTAWVYSTTGNNFVKSMLRLMHEKPELGVVYDQVGTPTWATGLAEWLWAVVARPELNGIYHWTDAGVASWYDFAVAIQELAVEKGMLKNAITVRPIAATEYHTPATRPAFSVIDKSCAEQASGLNTVHWRKQLSSMLDELKALNQKINGDEFK